MDMQGTPIGNIPSGTKNISDHERYQNPISGGTGPVASDSLAAESIRSGGAFAANKDNEPLGVNGSQSTFANTNTSDATILSPAPDVETRQAQDDWDESARLKGAAGLEYPEGLGGQGKFLGKHSEQGYAGGPTADEVKMQREGTSTYQTGFGEEKGAGKHSHADPVPTYANADQLDQPLDLKPKGKNVQEGGFDSDAPNASFNSDIGANEDPGRLAEAKFQSQNAESGPDAGYSRQKGLDDEGQGFDVLGSDETT